MIFFIFPMQVCQRRMDGKEKFFRNWQDYKLGFGDASKESWLGLGILHTLLNLNPQNELLIKMAHSKLW